MEPPPATLPAAAADGAATDAERAGADDPASVGPSGTPDIVQLDGPVPDLSALLKASTGRVLLVDANQTAMMGRAFRSPGATAVTTDLPSAGPYSQEPQQQSSAPADTSQGMARRTRRGGRPDAQQQSVAQQAAPLLEDDVVVPAASSQPWRRRINASVSKRILSIKGAGAVGLCALLGIAAPDWGDAVG